MLPAYGSNVGGGGATLVPAGTAGGGLVSDGAGIAGGGLENGAGADSGALVDGYGAGVVTDGALGTGVIGGAL